MTPARRRRLQMVLLLAVATAAAVALALQAFRQNVLFFYTPSQVAAGEAPQSAALQIGGIVEENSVRRAPGSLKVHFVITDTRRAVTAEYEGVLPDLFREGQGVVAKGVLRADGVLVASKVLAKHDENYMPPPAADALKAAQSLEY